jgi:hypothetical protein
MATPSMIIGWREYVSFPELGIKRLAAKIDTGARTSCLHAVDIEEFYKGKDLYVRFTTHPKRKSMEKETRCEAKVKDKRAVKSSNGIKTNRYVIVTDVCMGVYCWPIEMTLTSRKRMTYRMLFGRTSMGADFLINPMASYLQGEPCPSEVGPLREKLYKVGTEHV